MTAKARRREPSCACHRGDEHGDRGAVDRILRGSLPVSETGVEGSVIARPTAAIRVSSARVEYGAADGGRLLAVEDANLVVVRVSLLRSSHPADAARRRC
jgi:hypothetical protein